MHHRAKVKAEIVEKARLLHERDGVGPTELSKQFNVSINTIYDWIYYRTRINTDIEWQNERKKVQSVSA